MPRDVSNRITAREVLDTAPASPGLRVQQGQDIAGGKELWAVADALDNFVRTAPERERAKAATQTAKDKADFEAGKLQRQTSALTGDADAMLLHRPDVTDAFRKGYLESEGLVQLSKFHNDLAAEVSKLGPDDNFDEFVHGKVTAFMAEHESSDPNIRKTLVPGMERAVEHARGVYREQATKEMLARQEENIYSLMVEGLKDGSLATADGREKMYAFAARPEMGAMERRDVDAIFAKAYAERIASGDVEPAAMMAQLEAARPDGTPGLAHNPKYREALVAAAAHGQRVIDERVHAANTQREADLSFALDDKADRGILTDREIKDAAATVGKGDDAAWQLQWRNRNQASIRRLQNEAKERKEKRDVLGYILTNDPRAAFFPDDVKRKAVNDAALEAMDKLISGDPKGGAAVRYLAKVAEDRGITFELYKNQLAGFDPKNEKDAENLVSLYESLEAVSPDYALQHVDAKTAARMDHYQRLVRERRLSSREALDTMATATITIDEAKRDVGFAWQRASGGLPYKVPVDWWFDRPAKNPNYVNDWVRHNAETLMMTGSYKNGEDAIKKAGELFKAQHVVINDRYVPNYDLPKSAAPAIKALTDDIHEKLVAGKHLDKEDELSVVPFKGDPGKFVVVNAVDMIPIRDPDTGGRLLIDPRRLGAHHEQWELQQTLADTRTAQAVAQAKRSHVAAPEPADPIGAELPRHGKPRSMGSIDPAVLNEYRSALDKRHGKETFPEYLKRTGAEAKKPKE